MSKWLNDWIDIIIQLLQENEAKKMLQLRQKCKILSSISILEMTSIFFFNCHFAQIIHSIFVLYVRSYLRMIKKEIVHSSTTVLSSVTRFVRLRQREKKQHLVRHQDIKTLYVVRHGSKIFRIKYTTHVYKNDGDSKTLRQRIKHINSIKLSESLRVLVIKGKF